MSLRNTQVASVYITASRGKYDAAGRGGGKLFIGPFKDRRRPLVVVSRLRIAVECKSTREASQGRETTLVPGSDL